MEIQEMGRSRVRLTVVLCFLVIFTGLGFVSSPRSLYLAPVTAELGIDRTLYSVVDSLRYVATAAVNIFFGVLISRFGPRVLMAVGFLSLGGAMLCYTFATSVWLLYLSGVLLGIGFSFTSTTMVGYVITRTCRKNRGMVMGAVLAANGLGGAISTKLVSAMIHSDAGWRGSATTVAAIVLAVGLVTFLLFRNPPAEAAASAKRQEAVNTAEAPKRSPWLLPLLGTIIFISGFCLQGIQGVAAAHMEDVGLDGDLVANVLSMQMLLLTGSKFLTGFLYDRLGLRYTVLINMTLSVAVSVLLAALVPGETGTVMAFGYSLFSAMALPLETVMLPIYAREFFGTEGVAGRLGILVSVNTAGYALGSPFLNAVFDLTGSYFPGFLVTAVLMAAALALMQVIIPRRAKAKE